MVKVTAAFGIYFGDDFVSSNDSSSSGQISSTVNIIVSLMTRKVPNDGEVKGEEDYCHICR